MAESRTGLKFGHTTFKFQLQYLLQLHSKNLTITLESCEWVDANLGVLWVESEQILHLIVGCPNFDPVRGLAIYLPYLLKVEDLTTVSLTEIA